MYRQEEFMEYAKQYLGAEVSEESIKQVRDIGNTLKTTWNINDALIYGNSVVNFIPPAGVASLAFADGRYVNDSALGATVKSQYSLDPKQYDLWNPDGTLRRAGDNVYATFDTGYESPEEKLRKDVEELKKELKEIRDKQSKNE